ncbi:MAG: YscO family type III secretion system apparatus protein [Planctomycetota bacterium]
MKYPLHDLLRVRKFREEKLATELTKRRTELDEARQSVVDRRRERDEYIDWRVKREAELYDEVMNQHLGVADLDDLKLRIQLLRDDEVAYSQRVMDAEKHQAACEEAVVAAKADHLAAVRDSEKIEQHREGWAQVVAKEHEANQEKELEDFRVRTLEAGD